MTTITLTAPAGFALGNAIGGNGVSYPIVASQVTLPTDAAGPLFAAGFYNSAVSHGATGATGATGGTGPAVITASAGDLLIGDGAGNAVAFTAGTGELVYVDGSGHAATSPDLTFDAGSKTLSVLGGRVTGGIEINSVQDFGAPPFSNWFSYVDPNNFSRLKFGIDVNQVQYIADSIGTEAGNITQMVLGFFGTIDPNTGNPATGSQVQITPSVVDIILLDGSGFEFAAGALYPTSNNAIDLGVAGVLIWKNGYFGTELRSPLFSVASGAGNSGITTTITTASLVGKTITVKGGIITGFA